MSDNSEGGYEGRGTGPPRTWQVQEAKARFSELLETSLRDGPQVVTRRGVETAVIIPIEQWRRLRKPKYANIKEWLLAPEARGEIPIPPRDSYRMRPAPDFSDD